ncbi:MAG: hypothetical protein ACOYMB_01595 [Patescibacteria group bacterium]
MKNSLEKVRQEFERDGIESSIVLADMLTGTERIGALEYLLAEFIKGGALITHTSRIDATLHLLNRKLTVEEAKNLFEIRFNSKNNNVFELFSLIKAFPEAEKPVYYEKLLKPAIRDGMVNKATEIAKLLKRPLNDSEKNELIQHPLDAARYQEVPALFIQLGVTPFTGSKWEEFFRKEIKEKSYYKALEVTMVITDDQELKDKLLKELWELVKDGGKSQIIDQVCTALGVNWNQEINLNLFRQRLLEKNYSEAYSLIRTTFPEKIDELKQEIFMTAMKDGNYSIAKSYCKYPGLDKKQLSELLNNAIDNNDRTSVREIMSKLKSK